MLAVLAVRLVPQQFFPNSTRPELIVELRVRRGLVRRDHRAGNAWSSCCAGRGRALLHRLHGRRRPRFYLPGSRAAQPGLYPVRGDDQDLEAREARAFAPDGHGRRAVPQAWVRVTRLELGPPVGFPIQYRIVGADTQVVRAIARRVEHLVASNPQVRDVQLDWNDPVRALNVALDRRRCAPWGSPRRGGDGKPGPRCRG